MFDFYKADFKRDIATNANTGKPTEKTNELMNH
jgi:hypothetical protein